jgi:hypothetical protein
LGNHFGIVVAHFPNEMPTTEINHHLVERFKDLSEDDFEGNLIIIKMHSSKTLVGLKGVEILHRSDSSWMGIEKWNEIRAY